MNFSGLENQWKIVLSWRKQSANTCGNCLIHSKIWTSSKNDEFHLSFLPLLLISNLVQVFWMKQTDKWSKTLFYFENLIDFVIFIISPRNYIFGAFYLRCSYIVAFSFEWAWDFVNFFPLNRKSNYPPFLFRLWCLSFYLGIILFIDF